MAHINLLPWRAERRKQREREFFLQLGAAFGAALLALFLWSFWMGMRIDNQNERNAYLQGEIKQLDERIAKIKDLENVRQRLLARKQIIEQLQANRSQMVHLFDEMVKTIPDGARLDTMKQAGDTLTLQGGAESNSRVATYMRNIDNSPWMGRSDLSKIENRAGAKDTDKKLPYQFSLEVKLRKPDEAKKGEQDKEVPTGAAAGPATGKPAADAPAGTPPVAASSNAPGKTPAPATTGEKK